MIRRLTGKAEYAVTLCDAEINIWEGSVRSGKTISSILAWIKFVRHGPPGDLLMVGKTERTLIRNILNVIINMLGARRARIVAGVGEFWIAGRRIYIVGANNEEAQEKIRGMSLVGAYVDEASLVPESFWVMLLSRLSDDGARLFATTNPDAPAHWLMRDYLSRARLWLTGDGQLIERDEETALPLHRFSFRLTDNPSLNPRYVANLAKLYVGLWYRRFVLGEWVIADGAVYDMWDPARHVVSELPEIVRWLGVGIDVGTANPTSAVLLGLGADRRLYLAREWRWDSRAQRRQMTNAEYVTAIRDWLADMRISEHLVPGVRPERVYYDPAAADFGLQAFRSGMTNVAGAVHDVVPGIQMLASLLGSDLLRVHESCTGFLAEVSGYCWDPDAQLKGEDKPLKIDDHSLDAARYAIASTEPLWRSALALAA